MAQDLAALTNTWMLNPTMFDPTQASNQFSNYNNAALPWPPTYNTGAGGPVNAATGKPIQSFQQWQQQNPGGMVLNNTPAQPQAPQGLASVQNNPTPGTPQNLNDIMSNYGRGDPYGAQGSQMAGLNALMGGVAGPGRYGDQYMNQVGANYQQSMQPQAQTAPQQTSSWQQPNNWQAAINSLANPGNPVTQGANVPQQTGSQPAGGVNNAFLQQAGAGQGMNQNFLNALRSIQARPQG